jgi:hypothetical protein
VADFARLIGGPARPPIASTTPHGAIQVLKPFDPPPRPALNAIGPLAGVARTRVILT